ncbi:MAG: divalent-cation tolerance protein CutA [Patescibacteria group bacterium]
MDLRFLYITAKNTGEAKRIGRALVEEHLVACVNILENARSMYFWKGKLEEGNEAILFAKTRADLVHKVIDRVKKLHTYDCPCIVSLPILEGNPEFCSWIEEETGR